MTDSKEGTAEESAPREQDAANEAAPSKKSRAKKKPGRKTSTPRGRPRKEKIDPPAAEGEGGRQLLTAVNHQVVKRSADIAKALVDGTIEGSASHARLVVGLSGAGGLAAAPAVGSRRAEPTLRESCHDALTAEDLPGSEENWELDVEPEARPGYVPPKP